jgi:hypothetical protein
VQDAQGAGAHRAAEQLADQDPVGRVQGADGGAGQAGLDRRLAAPGAPGLGGDPEVAGVAAFEVGGDDGAGTEPAAEYLAGFGAERVGIGAEADAGLGAEVDVGDVEAGQLGDGAAGGGDDGGDRRCAQRGGRVGVHGPADGEDVQQFPGVVRAEAVAGLGLLGVEPVGQAEVLGERVEGVDPYPHRVRVGDRVRAAHGVPGAGPARDRVLEPGADPLGGQQLGQRYLAGAGALLRVQLVLGEEVLADPHRGRGQSPVREVAEEVRDGGGCWCILIES